MLPPPLRRPRRRPQHPRRHEFGQPICPQQAPGFHPPSRRAFRLRNSSRRMPAAISPDRQAQRSPGTRLSRLALPNTSCSRFHMGRGLTAESGRSRGQRSAPTTSPASRRTIGRSAFAALRLIAPPRQRDALGRSWLVKPPVPSHGNPRSRAVVVPADRIRPRPPRALPIRDEVGGRLATYALALS